MTAMLAFTAQLQLVLDEANDPSNLSSAAQEKSNNNFFSLFQAPQPKRRRLNPTESWSTYMADPENIACFTTLSTEFSKTCKSLNATEEPLDYIFQQYHNLSQSRSQSAVLLGLLYSILCPTSTQPLFDPLSTPISYTRCFLQLVKYTDIVHNPLQWAGVTTLIFKCLQQVECELIPVESALMVMTTILKRINVLPLYCTENQLELVSLGLKVVYGFLQSSRPGRPAHVTFHDLMIEMAQTFPVGVVVHWTLESLMGHLAKRRYQLSRLVIPPDASWPLMSQSSRQHEFANLTQRPSYLIFAPDYADMIKEGHCTTYTSRFSDLLYQRASVDEIFYLIRQLPQNQIGSAALRSSLVAKVRDVVKCIQRKSRFNQPRPEEDLHPQIGQNPEMLIPDNLDFMELMTELADQLYAFVGTELSPTSGYFINYEDLLTDFHGLVMGNSQHPPELEKDNNLIYLLLQLMHIDKIGGKDKLLAKDYLGDERLFSMLINLYNEHQVNSRDGFFLRDLSLQCAINHQQGYIRDRVMMKYRHPKLAIIWPYYSQVCYAVQAYFNNNFKNNVQNISTFLGLSTQENVKIAMESQLKQNFVGSTLFVYLVPNSTGAESQLDAKKLYLKGGLISYRLLDMLNTDTKHRLLGLIYKMMLDHDQGPRFHGDAPPSVKSVSPDVLEVIYKLLSSTPCSGDQMSKALFEKLRKYDRQCKIGTGGSLTTTTPSTTNGVGISGSGSGGGGDVPIEVTRWQFTVLQFLTFRMMRFFKFSPMSSHMLHYIKFSLSGMKHRMVYNIVETFAHSSMMTQVSHKFVRSLVDTQRDRPFWFEESEILARRGILTIARLVKLRGEGDLAQSLVLEALQIMYPHPLIFDEEILKFFPTLLRDFYTRQTMELETAARSSELANGLESGSIKALMVKGAVVEAEVSDLLDRSHVHNVLLVQKGTVSNSYLLEHYRDSKNHPYFLCVFWEIIMIHGQITETMLEDIRAVMLQFPPSQLSTYTQQLVDYALNKLDPQNSNPVVNFEFLVRVFEELVWKYQLLRIEHVLLALMTGHPTRCKELGMNILIQMTIHSQELDQRMTTWMSLGISPRPWEEDAYHDKFMQYLDRYPEYFGFEAFEMSRRQGGNEGSENLPPIHPPTEPTLLVYYNNVLLRLLNVFDMMIGRMIEYGMVEPLIELLEKFGALYLYHGTPLSFVRDILLYYHESPVMQEPRVVKALMRILDLKRVDLSPVLVDYIQDTGLDGHSSSSNSSISSMESMGFDENYVYDVCRKLAFSMDRKECGYSNNNNGNNNSNQGNNNNNNNNNNSSQQSYQQSSQGTIDGSGGHSDSHMPERHYREIANPATLGVYIAVIEILACPIPRQDLVRYMMNFASPNYSRFKVQNGNGVGHGYGHQNNTVQAALVLHSVGLLVAVLPKEFLDVVFQEFDDFVRLDKTLLHASTAEDLLQMMTTDLYQQQQQQQQQGQRKHRPAMRHVEQDLILSTIFNGYAQNRHNFQSNTPNSMLTFFHSICHYSSPDVLVRVVKLLEGWRDEPTMAGLQQQQQNLGGGGVVGGVTMDVDMELSNASQPNFASPATNTGTSSITSSPPSGGGMGGTHVQGSGSPGSDTTKVNNIHNNNNSSSGFTKQTPPATVKTDVQFLFICALIGPLVHRFERELIGGSAAHFFIVLLEIFVRVAPKQMPMVAQPPTVPQYPQGSSSTLSSTDYDFDFNHHHGGKNTPRQTPFSAPSPPVATLLTLERAIDFLHHTRWQLQRDPESSGRIAVVLQKMPAWARTRLGRLV